MIKLEVILSFEHLFCLRQSDRLKQVLDNLNTLNSLCMVLGMDFKDQIRDIHPTLDESKGSKNISDETIQRLSTATHNLRENKIQRLQKVSIFWLI